MQNFWRSGVNWDDAIGANEREEWQSWGRLLPEIENIRVPRCYLNACTSHDIQLHVFCDASEAAYAAVAYLRADHKGAIIGLRISKLIKQEVTLPVTKTIFWTDSKNVLHWIRSDARRYNQFVALRVGEILESSNPFDWRWVPSAENVADEGTKCNQHTRMDGDSRWFRAPEFLVLPPKMWPETHLPGNTDLEVLHHIQIEPTSNSPLSAIMPKAERFIKWEKFRAAQRNVLHFLQRLMRKPAQSKHLQLALSCPTIEGAENLIILNCQLEAFGEEINCLQRGLCIMPEYSALKEESTQQKAFNLMRKGQLTCQAKVLLLHSSLISIIVPPLTQRNRCERNSPEILDERFKGVGIVNWQALIQVRYRQRTAASTGDGVFTARTSCVEHTSLHI
ncbi:PREDICTED: uncharacterized protein LOC108364409 [Rhagoletis zephyria]|uniref:uncharacterized protein LOC108364409 n=1 Tax=Rhagoletis zephyria TaxID=28612 RepID=UPI000811651E|nr:PREDICTED: uncharacterized protein LOC108364409 [Rhagoletis zephyria]